MYYFLCDSQTPLFLKSSAPPLCCSFYCYFRLQVFLFYFPFSIFMRFRTSPSPTPTHSLTHTFTEFFPSGKWRKHPLFCLQQPLSLAPLFASCTSFALCFAFFFQKKLVRGEQERKALDKNGNFVEIRHL